MVDIELTTAMDEKATTCNLRATWEHDDKPTAVLFSLPQPSISSPPPISDRALRERERVNVLSLSICSSAKCLQLHHISVSSQVSLPTGNDYRGERNSSLFMLKIRQFIREAQNTLIYQFQERSFCFVFRWGLLYRRKLKLKIENWVLGIIF